MINVISVCVYVYVCVLVCVEVRGQPLEFSIFLLKHDDFFLLNAELMDLASLASQRL